MGSCNGRGRGLREKVTCHSGFGYRRVLRPSYVLGNAVRWRRVLLASCVGEVCAHCSMDAPWYARMRESCGMKGMKVGRLAAAARAGRQHHAAR
eukprot:scaffold62_cov256-Pinguiococcus_pyrenoidosus.AAC.25